MQCALHDRETCSALPFNRQASKDLIRNSPSPRTDAPGCLRLAAAVKGVTIWPADPQKFAEVPHGALPRVMRFGPQRPLPRARCNGLVDRGAICGALVSASYRYISLIIVRTLPFEARWEKLRTKPLHLCAVQVL